MSAKKSEKVMLKSIDLCLNSNFFSKIEQSCPLLSRTMDAKVFFVNIFTNLQENKRDLIWNLDIIEAPTRLVCSQRSYIGIIRSDSQVPAGHFF